MTKRQRKKAIIRQAYVDAASDMHSRDGECEIDGNAKVSMGDDPGAYVQAWVWVPRSKILGYLPEELAAEFGGGEE